MQFSEFVSTYQQRVGTTLLQFVPPVNNESDHLQEAMHYVLFNPGKRIRPLLVYACGLSLNVPLEKLDIIASAIEIIHVYSLIHDDLPAMDDSDLRRGKPSCHKAFDEATAILVGDALQTLAFEILSQDALAETAQQNLAIIQCLCKAIGVNGMAGGQSLDLLQLHQKLSVDEIDKIHLLKTGMLFQACLNMVAITADCSPEKFEPLHLFAIKIGLAFQIQDDVLDIEQSSEILGKPSGGDLTQGKNTYPVLIGLDAAKQRAENLLAESLNHLNNLNENTDLLRALAHYMVHREF